MREQKDIVHVYIILTKPVQSDQYKEVIKQIEPRILAMRAPRPSDKFNNTVTCITWLLTYISMPWTSQAISIVSHSKSHIFFL